MDSKLIGSNIAWCSRNELVHGQPPDTAFVKPAVERTSRVLSHKPDNLHADGAYQSPDNMEYCKEEEKITPYFTGIQGAPGRYDLEITK